MHIAQMQGRIRVLFIAMGSSKSTSVEGAILLVDIKAAVSPIDWSGERFESLRSAICDFRKRMICTKLSHRRGSGWASTPCSD